MLLLIGGATESFGYFNKLVWGNPEQVPQLPHGAHCRFEDLAGFGGATDFKIMVALKKYQGKPSKPKSAIEIAFDYFYFIEELNESSNVENLTHFLFAMFGLGQNRCEIVPLQRPLRVLISGATDQTNAAEH